jgi:hypothetical protein
MLGRAVPGGTPSLPLLPVEKVATATLLRIVSVLKSTPEVDEASTVPDFLEARFPNIPIKEC